MFKGKIKELAVWDGSLSAKDMAEVYFSGRPKNLKKHPKKSQLRGWWKLDGQTRNEVEGGNALQSSSATSLFSDTNSRTFFPSASVRFEQGATGVVSSFSTQLVRTWSISFWWINECPFEESCTLFSWGDVDERNEIFLEADTHRIGFRCGTGEFVSKLVPRQNKWCHCAVVMNIRMISFYVNGIREVFLTRPLEPYANNIFQMSLIGVVHQVAVYHTPLTEEDVIWSYHGKTSANLLEHPTTSFLLGLWQGHGYHNTVWYDESGQKKNMLISGDSYKTYQFPGWVEQRTLSFRGIESAMIHLTHVPYYNDFTWSLWFRNTTPFGTETVICQMGNGYRIVITQNGSIRVRSDVLKEILQGPLITDSDWHHVVLTRDQDRLFFYLDGLIVDTNLTLEPKLETMKWLMNVGKGHVTTSESKLQMVSKVQVKTIRSVWIWESYLLVAESKVDQVHIYQFQGNQPRLVQTIQGTPLSGFGIAMRMNQNHGDVYLYIGAPNDNKGSGKVYMYKKTASGSFQEFQVCSGSDGSQFGTSMDIQNELFIVGSPGSQKVTLLVWNEQNWEVDMDITETTPQFGTSVILGFQQLLVVSDTKVFCYQLNSSIPHKIQEFAPSGYPVIVDMYENWIIIGSVVESTPTMYSAEYKLYRWSSTLSYWTYHQTIAGSSHSTISNLWVHFLNGSKFYLANNFSIRPRVEGYEWNASANQWQFFQTLEQSIDIQQIVTDHESKIAVWSDVDKVTLFSNEYATAFSYFRGNITDISLFKRALPQTDIERLLYNKGDPQNLVDLFSRQVLQGYWRFGSDQEKRITDLSGYREHGMIDGSNNYELTYPSSIPVPSTQFEVVRRFHFFSFENIGSNQSGTISLIVLDLNDDIKYQETWDYVKHRIDQRIVPDLLQDTYYQYQIIYTNSKSGKQTIRNDVIRTNMAPPITFVDFTVRPTSRGFIFEELVSEQVGYFRFIIYSDSSRMVKLYDHQIPYLTAEIMTVFTISGLESSTLYEIEVQCGNLDYEYSSEFRTMMTNPPPPQLLTSQITHTSTSLQFSNLTFHEPADVYVAIYSDVNRTQLVQQSPPERFDISGSGIDVTFTVLDPETVYYYTIYATNDAGDTNEIKESYSTTSFPSLLRNIIVTTTDTTAKFSDVQLNKSGRIVYRVIDSSGTTFTKTTQQYINQRIDTVLFTGLTTNVEYSYTIEAYNEVDEMSSFSGTFRTRLSTTVSKGSYVFDLSDVTPGMYYWNKVMNHMWSTRLTNGNTCVVWCAKNTGDAGGYGIFLQMCSSQGVSLLTTDFAVDTDTGDDVLPCIVETSANVVAIAYHTRGSSTYDNSIQVRIVTLSSNSASLTTSFSFGTEDMAERTLVSIAKYTDGQFILVWSTVTQVTNENYRNTEWSCGRHGQRCGRTTLVSRWFTYNYRLQYCIYNTSGSAIRGTSNIDSLGNFLSFDAVNLVHGSPSIATYSDVFVIAWERNNGVYFRVVRRSDFGFATSSILVATLTNPLEVSFSFPYVYRNDLGTRIYLFWQENTYNDGKDAKILSRTYDLNGIALMEPKHILTVPNDTTMPIEMIELPSRLLLAIPSMSTTGDTSVRFVTCTKDLSTVYSETVIGVENLVTDIGTCIQILPIHSFQFSVLLLRTVQKVVNLYTFRVDSLTLSIPDVLPVNVTGTDTTGPQVVSVNGTASSNRLSLTVQTFDTNAKFSYYYGVFFASRDSIYNTANITINSANTFVYIGTQSSPTDFDTVSFALSRDISGNTLLPGNYYVYYVMLDPANNRTVNDTTPFGPFVVFDFTNTTSITWNGSSQYGSVDMTSWNFYKNFSVSAWIKLSSVNRRHTIFHPFATSGNTYNNLFIVESNNLLRFYNQSPSAWNVDGTTTLTTGIWYHVVATRSDTNVIRLYLNGVQNNTDVASKGDSTSYSGSIFLDIARDWGRGSTEYFFGIMDEYSVWNTTLSSAQVTELYNNGIPTNLNSHSANASLQGWWRFENDGTDSSGKERHLLLTGGPSFTTDSSIIVNSRSMSMNGTTQYASALYPALLYPNDYTISLWVKTSTTTRQKVIAWESSNGSIRLQLNWNVTTSLDSNGGISFSNIFISSTNINNNNWHHITITHNSSNNIMIYLDGVQISTGTHTVVSTTSSDGVYIGILPNLSTGGMYNGLLDEVSIWNTALAHAQVSELWNLGKPGNLLNHTGSLNLQAWWRFENNGNDSSGKGRHLTLVNAPTYSTDIRG